VIVHFVQNDNGKVALIRPTLVMTKEDTMLRFDGLYAGPPKTSGGGDQVFFDYLRFYEDGVVINCVSLGKPEQVIRWFYRENPEQSSLLRGPYTLNGDEISFSPEFRDMDEGQEIVIKTDYQGLIVDGGLALELQVGSTKEGANSREIYHFTKVSAKLNQTSGA